MPGSLSAAVAVALFGKSSFAQDIPIVEAGLQESVPRETSWWKRLPWREDIRGNESMPEWVGSQGRPGPKNSFFD